MEQSTIRVLVVDDYEPWRRQICSTLQQYIEFQVVGEVSDGLDAVHEAKRLQPDLVLLDIGLPKLNGIEAARQIRKYAPQAKILFVSENRSWDVAEEALRTGAGGYVVKSDASRELLPAIRTVVQGWEFISARFAGRPLTDDTQAQIEDHPNLPKTVPLVPRRRAGSRHEVGFYSDDQWFLDDLTHFIGGALKVGNAAIVVATASHLHCLLPRLQAYGVDIGGAIEHSRYVALDAADTLSMFMLNGMPDPIRFVKAFREVISRAAEAAKGEHPRVAVFGECVQILWAQGNAEAAIQMEKLGNQLTNSYDVEILCGYSLGKVQGRMDSYTFQRICAEHSAAYCR